uniref:Uncharacterized protein n=1 Tax=Anguilla anguilla TaxID=7936 RepID=A0A0E9UCF0_ANGAN
MSSSMSSSLFSLAEGLACAPEFLTLSVKLTTLLCLCRSESTKQPWSLAKCSSTWFSG